MPGHRCACESLSGPAVGPCTYPYVYLDATYLHGRLGQNKQVVSRAVVVAIGNRYAEAQGLQRPRLPRWARHCPGRQRGGGLLAPFLRLPLAEGCGAVGAWPHWTPAGDLRRPPGADGSDQPDVPGQ
jgi:hypothetical protein